MNPKTALTNGQIDDINNIREAADALRDAISAGLDTVEDVLDLDDDMELAAALADIDRGVNTVLGRVASVIV